MIKKTAFIIFLLLAVTLHLFGTTSCNSENTPSDVKKENSLTISVQRPDSSDIRTVTTLMQNMPSNGSNTSIEISITKKDTLQNTVTDSIWIDEVYHYSFFKKRKNAMAMGFENYFVIHDFPGFKKKYLDSYDSDQSKLVFFGNGSPFPPQKIFLFDEQLSTISFMLTRNDSLTQKFVHSFISKFKFRIKDPFVGFGYYDTRLQKWITVASVEIRQFDILKPYTLILVGVWFVFLVIVFYQLGKKTNLLKTGIADDSSYSLSLTQFAFWTVIIFTSYFYLWMVNLELATIPTSTLILLGITASTTASSRAVDITSANKQTKFTTKSLFKDLLTDGDSGYSVNRCQLVLVTLMFGAFYMVNVVRTQELPDFDNSLLWMIGISSGTFVGIKKIESLKQELGKGNTAMKSNPPSGADQTPTNNSVV